MNELTPYEQLIAAKLEAVPVPDLGDSIWAGIEMQLDALSGMPAAPARKHAFSVTRKGWYGIAGIVVMAVLLWWYFGHRGSREATPPNPLPQTQHSPAPAGPPPVADSPALEKPVKRKSIPAAPAGIKKDTVAHIAVTTDSIGADPAPGGVLPPLVVDSSSVQKNRPVLPEVDLYQPSPPAPQGKKPRGVKGIGDDDYKLTATKDSARKKH